MKRERCPMCLADDVEGKELCRCGVRFERDDRGRIRRAHRRRHGSLIWQLVFQRRSNSSEEHAAGFSDAPHKYQPHIRRETA